MNADGLVAACSTVREQHELCSAVMAELGPRESALLLRELFYVNGTRATTAEVLKALDDVRVEEFDKPGMEVAR